MWGGWAQNGFAVASPVGNGLHSSHSCRAVRQRDDGPARLRGLPDPGRMSHRLGISCPWPGLVWDAQDVLSKKAGRTMGSLQRGYLERESSCHLCKPRTGSAGKGHVLRTPAQHSTHAQHIPCQHSCPRRGSPRVHDGGFLGPLGPQFLLGVLLSAFFFSLLFLFNIFY